MTQVQLRRVEYLIILTPEQRQRVDTALSPFEKGHIQSNFDGWLSNTSLGNAAITVTLMQYGSQYVVGDKKFDLARNDVLVSLDRIPTSHELGLLQVCMDAYLDDPKAKDKGIFVVWEEDTMVRLGTYDNLRAAEDRVIAHIVERCKPGRVLRSVGDLDKIPPSQAGTGQGDLVTYGYGDRRPYVTIERMPENSPMFKSNGHDGAFLEHWKGMDLYLYDYGNGNINPVVRLGNLPHEYRSSTIYQGAVYNVSANLIQQLPELQAQARIIALAQEKGLISRGLLHGGSLPFREEIRRHGGTI